MATDTKAAVRCACQGFSILAHKTRCRNLTEQAIVVDIDIKPLPMCERCLGLCFMVWWTEPGRWPNSSTDQREEAPK